MALSKILNASVTDSTLTTTKLATPNLGRRNLVTNGAMQVAQRGTSIAVSSTLVYTLDRFAAENDTTTMTATQASDAPTDFKYSLKLTNGTGATATGTHINRLVTKLEGYDTNHLEIGTANAKKVTLSFHVKSSITGTYIVSFLDSGNDNGYPASYTINSANTWEKKTITLTMSDYGSWVGSTTNSANLIIHWDLGSGPDRDLSNLNAWNDGAANDFSHSSQTEWVGTTGSTFYLTGVQMEVGEQATPFEHRSYGEELALCQRYLETGHIESVAAFITGTVVLGNIFFRTTKRAEPAIAFTTAYTLYVNGSTPSLSTNTVNGTPDIDTFVLRANSTVSNAGKAAHFRGGVYTADSEL